MVSQFSRRKVRRPKGRFPPFLSKAKIGAESPMILVTLLPGRKAVDVPERVLSLG